MKFTVRISIAAAGTYDYGADTFAAAQVLAGILAGVEAVSGGEIIDAKTGKTLRKW